MDVFTVNLRLLDAQAVWKRINQVNFQENAFYIFVPHNFNILKGKLFISFTFFLKTAYPICTSGNMISRILEYCPFDRCLQNLFLAIIGYSTNQHLAFVSKLRVCLYNEVNQNIEANTNS